MVGKWRLRGQVAAEGWGGRLADCLLRQSREHTAHRCSRSRGPPPEWYGRLSDDGPHDVERLTSATLNSEAKQAVACAAEFVLKRSKKTVFGNVCFSLATRGYKYDPAFVLCVFVGDALFGSAPPDCLESLYLSNTTLLSEKWMDAITLEELASEVHASVRPDPSLVPKRAHDWDDKLATALLDPDDDALLQAAFPPRSPQDLGIR